jgi:hypothetical protein
VTLMEYRKPISVFTRITVRQVLGIDPALKMLFGIYFGKPDMRSAASNYRISQAPLDEIVTFHR